jgi:hypothetical protein
MLILSYIDGESVVVSNYAYRQNGFISTADILGFTSIYVCSRETKDDSKQ